MITISIVIMSILILYKLVQYTVNLKAQNNHSMADIIFVMIICCLLFIPMSHIDKRQKSKLENRILAKAPVLIKQHKLNLDYGKNFNKWFEDRFFTRKQSIKINTTLKCFINYRECRNRTLVYDKKYNIVYRDTNFWGMAPMVKNKNQKLKLMKHNLNKFAKFCQNNNIKLYILVVPRQSDYFEIDNVRKNIPNPADEVIDYLNKNTDIKIIYPKNEMQIANKETPVYFKTDHHWTKKGAYVGYNTLIKEIQKDFPAVPLLEESSLKKYYDNRVSDKWNKKLFVGRQYEQFGLPKFYLKKVLDIPYTYYKNPYAKNLKHEKTKFVKYAQDVNFYYPKGKKRVLIIADSFGNNLCEFIPYSFKDTLFLYDNRRRLKFKKYENTIIDYKPDVLVLLFYTKNLYRFLNLYPEKSVEKEIK